MSEHTSTTVDGVDADITENESLSNYNDTEGAGVDSVSDIDYEEHDIDGSQDLIISTIKDQADNLEKSWRESVTNGIDAPDSDSCWMWWSKARTIVTDDGSGESLSDSDRRELFTKMGASTKAIADDSTIGRFGIGKGQFYAKGYVTIITNGEAIHFNINDWGITDGAKQCSVDDAVEFTAAYDADWSEHVAEGIEKHKGGLTVVISHYEDETPSYEHKWERYEENVANRFKYSSTITGVDVYVNDELISDGSLNDEVSGSYVKQDTLTGEPTGRVEYAIEHSASGSIDVYSNGVFVRSIKSDGFSGAVLTYRNLDLNFARNEIKSGCEIWNAVTDELEDAKLNICESMPTKRMCDAAREYVTKRMLNDDDLYSQWKDENLLKGATDSYHSIEEVREKGRVGYASSGKNEADDITEATGDIVLSTNDSAVKQFKENQSDEIDTFDVEQRAVELGLLEQKERIPIEELTPRQRNKLGVARTLADRLGITRTIHYGKSSSAHAWTDGQSFIVITDSAGESGNWESYTPELYETIIHEWVHTLPTEDSDPGHGAAYNDEFRERLTKNWDVLSELIRDISENGIREYRAQ